jgi:hypothetical protein
MDQSRGDKGQNNTLSPCQKNHIQTHHGIKLAWWRYAWNLKATKFYVGLDPSYGSSLL